MTSLQSPPTAAKLGLMPSADFYGAARGFRQADTDIAVVDPRWIGGERASVIFTIGPAGGAE